jgi:hypothetical protein
LAVEFKESRPLWYRELLSLEVDDPDTLVTQLDGAYATALVRHPSAGWAAVAAARVLIKSAGVRITAGGPTPHKARRVVRKAAYVVSWP